MFVIQDFFSSIFATFHQFVEWDHIAEIFSKPETWFLILSLIVIEGLLSADNALVLAAMVKDLPAEKRKRALLYGLWGAYVFRFISIGLGVYLVKLSFIKFIGGGYLAYLAIKFFYDKYKGAGSDEEGSQPKMNFAMRIFGQFWGTVFMVELMDIAFSIDSILAALAISDEVWILFLGGIFGILMMRGVAGVFLSLLEKIPSLESAAFFIILFIGLKMIFAGFNLHITDIFSLTGETAETVDTLIFFGFLVIVFSFTYIRHKMTTKPA